MSARTSPEPLASGKISYIRLKDFDRALSALFNGGGLGQKRAEKVHGILGRLGIEEEPFRGVPVTNHGENRIDHAVKYDLGDGYRLVTVQNDSACFFCYAGTHSDADKWINSNSGLKPARDKDGRWKRVYESGKLPDEMIRRETVPTRGKIMDRLAEEHHDFLLEGVSPRLVAQLYALDEASISDDVRDICERVPDVEKGRLVYDVMCLLLAGDVEGAESSIGLAKGDVRPLDDLDPAELLEIADGAEMRRIRVGSPEHAEWLDRFSRSAPYFDWLLHMHPEQEATVKADFEGPAQLSGVSGSGKTCVAVRRAVRLASEAEGRRVLVVTLNRSLSGLIERLVEAASPTEECRSRIHVTSFFQLCQQILNEREPQNARLYDDVTWKLGEHMDEVFREYYRCWNNNVDARVLWPVHQSLAARGVWAETYVREEFDWIRTAVKPWGREHYNQLERIGRKLPLTSDWRTLLLAGLSGWEKKMRDVGVIDYLGLTTAVLAHEIALLPVYDAAIIDEAQDFGTTELGIIRRLVKEGRNDLFLCGDIAQHVLPKHRTLSDAGILTHGRSRRITRNYRNTREILKAAFNVLMKNLDETLIDSSDLELLDPVLANRSGALPMVLSASSLEEEIARARSFVDVDLEDHPEHRCCIALAGYSLREVQFYAEKLGIPVLDGTHDPAEVGLVLSDLEQTKGYEFNIMLIVNCRDGVLPPRDMPEEESFRHGCLLYVAMTRARDELYLFSSGSVSPWLENAKGDLHFDEAKDLMPLNEAYLLPPPSKLPQTELGDNDDVGLMNGWEYTHTPHAVGLSAEALAKLVEVVDGVGLRRGKESVKWKSVRALAHDLQFSPRARFLVGPRVQEELRKNFEGRF